MRGAAAAMASCLVVVAACGDPASPTANAAASPVPPSPVPANWAAAAGPARFSVRARWPDPSHIRLRLEGGAPIGDAAFTRAVERAMKVWNDTGSVGFEFATGDAAADVTLGWRRGPHDHCAAFGPNAEVAHTGPSAPGTFLHFDLGRRWSEQGPDHVSVFHTALHELGHVLGLGHSEAPEAVMSTDLPRPAELSRHDLAGLHSLYGGGADGDGDLQLTRADGSIATTLHEVAPVSCCNFTAFDCDGDGRDEVVVWRTDAAGYGALTLYFFDPKARLVRTLGPFYGVVTPAARVGCVRGPGGERLLVSALPKLPAAVRQFGDFGIPGMPAAASAAELLARATTCDRADFDGDGTAECTVRRASH